MRKIALRGFWATCVCAALSATASYAAPPDVVLYAADATRLTGNWTRVADTTAAGGQNLTSTDRGWQSPDSALAQPADALDFTFAADAATPYHVWVRLRAAGNSKFNDSLFAQFSDAVTTTGTPLFRLGTTSALILNLQNSNGAKLNGWGWVDGAYWLSQLSTVSFSASGAHTLRLQIREDGVQIDQVVLSPATYLTVAPGQRSGDSTIVAKPAVAPAPVPTPYSGVASALPGTIQAEDFDNGGEGVAYHDADGTNAGGAYRTGGTDLEVASEGGYDVGWITAGEWLGYSVNVKSAGSYLFEARVAAPSQGGTFHVEVGGVNVTGTLTIPATGSWQTWTTLAKTVTLAAGPQRLTVVFDAPGAAAFGNLNWFRVSVPAAATAAPYTGMAVTLPGTLALDAFDTGGEGLAYHDLTTGNSGTGRSSDVDLETSSMGTPDIGWIDAGEWVRYSVNVTTAGTYLLTAKVASPNSTGSLHVTVGTVSTPVTAVPLTGSWQTWQELSWTATLAAGPQVLTLAFDTGGFNLGAFSVATAIAGAIDPIAPPPSPAPAPATAPSAGSTVISVPRGGDLQAAINAAVAGDTILLEAGATYIGNFTLPVKSGTGYVTIRTNITDPVPAGTRLTPAKAVNLAKIKSPNTFTAMATQPYAHHYVLQLLDFAANVGGYGEVISLGDGSNAQNTLAMVPHDLIVDRVYVHGDASGQKRGIGLNSASTTIRDSYIANIWYVGQDSQAIAGWNGPGPYTITNNYLEAASENFLLGGADPAIVDLIPSDVVFTRNYVTKPLAWKARSDINVKNLFELKNGQRVTIDGNIFENNWLAAQAGYSIVFTGRSQDGLAPWSVVKDLVFTNNIVRHVASGINILGHDYRYPSGTSTHFVFRNNLFYDVSGRTYGGDGRFMLINGGVDVTVDHNTIIQDGNSVLYADTNPVQQFVMTNNIAPDNLYGIMGGGTSPGNGTIATFFPNSTFLRGIWAGAPYYYPTGNFYPTSLQEVGFMDLTNGNYRLAATSVYRNAALDGTDVGANIDVILAATAGVQ